MKKQDLINKVEWIEKRTSLTENQKALIMIAFSDMVTDVKNDKYNRYKQKTNN